MPAKPKPPLPKTEAEWSAYRVELKCNVGKGIIDGSKPVPPGATRTEYALFLMFSAISELSRQITQNQQKP